MMMVMRRMMTSGNATEEGENKEIEENEVLRSR